MDIVYSKTPYTRGLDKVNNRFGKPDNRELIILFGYMSSGKCHAKGTGIIMADGKIKKVEDIVVGDNVMGVDSRPRKVLQLARGQDTMYKIIPNQGGDSFIVNSEHKLQLVCVGGRKTTVGQKKSMKVCDILKQGQHYTTRWKLYKGTIEFKEQKLEIEPYYLGLWLGDGRSAGIDITNMDKEVIDYIQGYANRLNMEMTTYAYKDRCPSYAIKGGMQITLKEMGLKNNKHIPNNYLHNNRENRLKLLAGLIDSDGWIQNGNYYGFSNKNEILIDQVLYLARSLGIKSAKRSRIIKDTTYFQVDIRGNISQIPVKIERKKCKKKYNKNIRPYYGYKIENVGHGSYYGFELDGDHLYMTDDFFVHHNTEFSYFVARKNISVGVNVCYISLELPEYDMKLRIARKTAGVSKIDFQNGNISPYQKDLMNTKFKELNNTEGLYIVKPEDNSLGSIETTIHQHYDKGCRMFFIDNLDKIGGDDNDNTRYQKISSVLQDTKNDLGINITLIHHAKKPFNKEQQYRPAGMSGLRGSQKILDNATQVIEIWRDLDPEIEDKKEKARVQLHQYKDTFEGANGYVDIYFNKGGYKDEYEINEIMNTNNKTNREGNDTNNDQPF